MKKYKLDKYEQDILDSVERGEWESVSDFKEVKKLHQQIARNTLKKDKRVNIRISQKDLDAIRVSAMQEGIPYQTHISSILHKYVTGSLVSAPRSRYDKI